MAFLSALGGGAGAAGAAGGAGGGFGAFLSKAMPVIQGVQKMQGMTGAGGSQPMEMFGRLAGKQSAPEQAAFKAPELSLQNIPRIADDPSKLRLQPAMMPMEPEQDKPFSANIYSDRLLDEYARRNQMRYF
jgi:hypothetical protein